MNVAAHDAYIMLTIYCPTHNSYVLVGPRRIRRLVNTEYGIGLVVECYCGHCIQVVTGSRSRAGEQAVPV